MEARTNGPAPSLRNRITGRHSLVPVCALLLAAARASAQETGEAPALVDAPAPIAREGAGVARPAQEASCEDDPDAPEGAGSFLVGAGSFDFSSLNGRLGRNGYSGLPSLRTLIGGEGHAVFASGFVAGARGGAILGAAAEGPDGLRARFGGGFGMVDLGFQIVHTRPLLFTLTAGVGGYGASLEVSDGQSASFDDVLRNPRRSVTMGTGGLLVGLTAGLDGRVPIGHVERGRRGFFTMGGRVGALYGPALGSWGFSDGGQTTAGPAMALAGVYGALTIGFGGGRMGAGDRPAR